MTEREWYDIETLQPGATVIGIRLWPESNDCGVICGEKYDLMPNCVIDRQRGRWMACTHWCYPPSPHTYQLPDEGDIDTSPLAK